MASADMIKSAKFNPLRFLRAKAEKRELSPDLDDVLASALLQHMERVNGRAAGCKHRVNQNDDAVVDVRRKLAVVFVRFVSYRVSV